MSATATVPVTLEQNPWPGLLWYTEQQANLFFGRDAEIDELIRLIDREILTTLFGRSGLGKTSLLRAGIFPRLRAAGYFPVVLRLDYSAEAISPPQQVVALTRAAAVEAGIEIENPAAQPLTLWEYFHQVHFWGPRNDRLTPVLVFDQFEEIFTIGSRLGTDAALLEQLADLAENRIPAEVRERAEQSPDRKGVDVGVPNYKIVLSLREDFVWRIDTMRPILPAIMRNRFALGPLDTSHGLEIISKAGGAWVSDVVAHDIIEAVISSRQSQGLTAAGEIEPVYLNVMCSELFQRMVAAGQTQITRDLVESEKGGILESLYERSLAGLPLSARLFVENHLVISGGFRATVPVVEALREGISEAELDTLVDRRLLRFEDRLGTRHVELAHDLLTGVVLASRDERQRADLRRHLFRAGARAVARSMALIIFAALAVAVVYWLGYVRPTVKYYGDFAWRNGSIQPLWRLSRTALSHREESYRVTRDGWWGRIASVEAVNGFGDLVSHSRLETSMFYNPSGYTARPYCCLEFTYGEDGRVSRETVRDKMHQMVYMIVYDSSQATPFRNVQHASLLTVQARSGASFSSNPDQSAAASSQGTSVLGTFDIEYNSSGYMDQVTYASATGTTFSYKARIVRFDLDSSGRPTGETFWSAPGKPVGGDDGFEGKAFQTDANGQLIQTTYHNRSSAPVAAPSGIPPVIRWKLDRWGNQVEESYFDGNGKDGIGKPAVWEAAGYHTIRYVRSEQGIVREIDYLDAADHPVAAKDTGCYQVAYQLDGSGNITEDQCLGPMGARLNRTDFGFQKRTWVNDPDDRPVEVQFFAANRQPIAPRDGCFGYLIDYDAGGNQIPDVCLDPNGKVVNSPANLAHLSDHSRITHEESFDFPRALYLDQQIASLLPSTSSSMNLEEAALTADNFQLCLQQANSVANGAVDQDHQVIRDAIKLACQFGAGDKAGARATAASLIASGAHSDPFVWTFDGTLYYVDTSSPFRSDQAWDDLFENLQNGNSKQAVDALRRIQTHLM